MRIAAISAALLLASPLRAQDPASDYDRAVAARLSGNAETAARLLEPLVAANPTNTDARLQLGLSQLALGRLDEAEANFRRTLELAPDYADARLGLARVAQRRGNTKSALAILEPLPAENTEAEALRRTLMASGSGRSGLRLDMDVRYSRLNGRRDWREGSIRVAKSVSDATIVAGSIDLASRFGKTDAYGEVQVDHKFTDAARAYVLAGGTPDANFRPRWQLGAGGSVRLTGGDAPTVLTLDLRNARYASGTIRTVNPGVEQYLLGGRAWLTGRWINIFAENGDRSAGWLARGDTMVTDRLRLFAGAADAPDTSEGIVVETSSLFGGLAVDLNDRHSLRLSVAREDREIGPRRLEVSLGFGARF